MTDGTTLIRKAAATPARVLLAGQDDGPRTRARAAFDRGRRVEVVAETACPDRLADAADALAPDLIVLCAGPAASANGVRALAERCPGTPLLVLGRGDASSTAAALRAAADCLRAMADHATADAGPDGLLAAVRPHGPPPARGLTVREREVLQSVADGLSSKEIAARLSISVRTVESHRNQVMKKVGLRSVAGLTKFAIRQGLVTL